MNCRVLGKALFDAQNMRGDFVVITMIKRRSRHIIEEGKY